MNPPDSAPDRFPADTPSPPYFAVIFSSLRTPGDDDRYASTAARMIELVRQQPGFLGFESVRGDEGQGITVSYWSDLASIAAWKQQAEHLLAQQSGRDVWYSQFALRVCRVEDARTFRRAVETESLRPTFADLVESRKAWIQRDLRGWCQRASRQDLLLAEAEWFDIAGKADPAKTLWAWAWSRFPDLVHGELGIDESAEVQVTLADGRMFRGYPDARQSLGGRLVLVSRETHGPFPIDDIAGVRRVSR